VNSPVQNGVTSVAAGGTTANILGADLATVCPANDGGGSTSFQSLVASLLGRNERDQSASNSPLRKGSTPPTGKGADKTVPRGSKVDPAANPGSTESNAVIPQFSLVGVAPQPTPVQTASNGNRAGSSTENTAAGLTSVNPASQRPTPLPYSARVDADSVDAANSQLDRSGASQVSANAALQLPLSASASAGCDAPSNNGATADPGASILVSPLAASDRVAEPAMDAAVAASGSATDSNTHTNMRSIAAQPVFQQPGLGSPAPAAKSGRGSSSPSRAASSDSLVRPSTNSNLAGNSDPASKTSGVGVEAQDRENPPDLAVQQQGDSQTPEQAIFPQLDALLQNAVTTPPPTPSQAVSPADRGGFARPVANGNASVPTVKDKTGQPISVPLMEATAKQTAAASFPSVAASASRFASAAQRKDPSRTEPSPKAKLGDISSADALQGQAAGANAPHPAAKQDIASLQPQAVNNVDKSAHSLAGENPSSKDGSAKLGTGSFQAAQGAASDLDGDDSMATQLPSVLNTGRLVQGLNQSELRIGLHTRELGSVDIHTSMAAHTFSAQIFVEHADVARTLSSELPSLYARLADHQVPTGPIQIHGDGMNTSGGFEQGKRQEYARPYESSQRVDGVGPLSATMPMLGAVIASDRLDIRI